jgi:hypothetical protein
MDNLDLHCAKLGEELGQYNDDETLLTNSLGVLEEQGVYAYFLYLKARGKKPGADISKKCSSFLTDLKLIKACDADVFGALEPLANDLDNLLYARDLLRQSLIYARYHAKASTQERPKQQMDKQPARQKAEGKRT